jgi:starvation-inducible outer membrane lipoprotein
MALIVSTKSIQQEEIMQKMKMLLVLSMAMLLSACAST